MLKVLLSLLAITALQFNLTDERLHEYIGLFFLLFAARHVMRQTWWLRHKDRFNPLLRMKSLSSVILLTLCGLVLISGLLISRNAFPFMRIKGIQDFLIDVHHVCGICTFIAVCVHVGLHLRIKPWISRMSAAFFAAFGAILISLERLPELTDFVMSMESPELAETLLLASGLPFCLIVFVWFGTLLKNANFRSINYA